MRLYIIDAFTDTLFSGNPAAVCPLDGWLPDKMMQNIAFENNLAETAFIAREEDKYRIRWFTPAVEVDLCGHATLASAHVLFSHLGFNGKEIKFNSRSGELVVTKKGDELTLNFPIDIITPVALTSNLSECFNIKPSAAFKGKSDYMFVFERQEDIENIVPDMKTISLLEARGVIITAQGNEVDFVSRFFAPQSGIDEDPVTGSAHTSLTPYWADRLGKASLTAKQISKRGGSLNCELKESRVLISGRAITYLIGDIQLNNS